MHFIDVKDVFYVFFFKDTFLNAFLFVEIPKIPVLKLVANKIGDTFLDYKIFRADLA